MNSTDLLALVRTQDGGVIARPDHWTLFSEIYDFSLTYRLISICNIAVLKHNSV